jgi:hypothetical protein
MAKQKKKIKKAIQKIPGLLGPTCYPGYEIVITWLKEN